MCKHFLAHVSQDSWAMNHGDKLDKVKEQVTMKDYGLQCSLRENRFDMLQLETRPQ